MKNGQEPAFPVTEVKNRRDWHGDIPEMSVEKVSIAGGLTKREYFAGLAMQGMLAANIHHINVIQHAPEIADALLEELAKEAE